MAEHLSLAGVIVREALSLLVELLEMKQVTFRA